MKPPPNHRYFQLLLWNHPIILWKSRFPSPFLLGPTPTAASPSPHHQLGPCSASEPPERASWIQQQIGPAENMAPKKISVHLTWQGEKNQVVHLYPLSDVFPVGKMEKNPFAILVWMGNWVDFVSSIAHNCQANMREMPPTCEKKVVGQLSENLQPFWKIGLWPRGNLHLN